jgi:hypothetical protein
MASKVAGIATFRQEDNDECFAKARRDDVKQDPSLVRPSASYHRWCLLSFTLDRSTRETLVKQPAIMQIPL